MRDMNDSTFEAVSKEWMSKMSQKWVETTIKNTQAKPDKHILPWIGSMPISKIEGQMYWSWFNGLKALAASRQHIV